VRYFSLVQAVTSQVLLAQFIGQAAKIWSMDRETFAGIAEQYPWASWAVWDDAFPDGDCVEKRPERLVEFVHDQAEMLTPAIVLMGLNRSDDLPAPTQTSTHQLRSTTITG